MTRLHTLARRGDYEEAVVCISQGADVNAVSVYFFTPLMLAAQNQHLPLVNLLLASGARFDIAHPNGRTPLHFAAAVGCLPIVEALAAHGANVNAISNIGCTPMIEAAWFNYSAVVAFLKDQGADSSILSREGRTADQWLEIGGVPGEFRKLFPHSYALEDNPHARPLARENSEQNVRRLMSGGGTPEEYAAKHGRNILMYSYGHYSFRDPAVERWAHRLGELLSKPELIDEYEEQFLTGLELEEARRHRARRIRRSARAVKNRTS